MKKYFLYFAFLCFLLYPNYTGASFRLIDNNTKTSFAISPQLFGSVYSTAISDFVMSFSPVNTLVNPTSTTTVTINEVVYDSVTAANTITTCLVSASNGASGTYQSATPSIATVDSSGNTTFVSNGTAEIMAHSSERWRAVYCPISQTHNTPINLFNSFATGSFSKADKDSIDAFILNKTPSATTQAVYSVIDDSSKLWTRNTLMFGSSLDLTAIPVYSDTLGRILCGVLISPDIILYAVHASKVANGSNVYFVGNDNVTVTRTVLSQMAVDSSSGYNDLYIARLSSAVPATITPAKLAPADIFTQKHTSESSSSLREPVFYYRSQTRSMYLGSYSGNSTATITFQTPPTASGYATWFTTPITGDSASPVFFVANGSPVLLGTLFGATIPSNVSTHLTQIGNAITTLGGSQFTTFDDSSYNNYGS